MNIHICKFAYIYIQVYVFLNIYKYIYIYIYIYIMYIIYIYIFIYIMYGELNNCKIIYIYRFRTQIPNFQCPISGVGYYLGAKRPANLQKQVAFPSIVQGALLFSCKPGPIKHLKQLKHLKFDSNRRLILGVFSPVFLSKNLTVATNYS